jgi:hypothetical protein
LAALAYTSPPDLPSIPGIYDDDGVVAMVTDATGVNDSRAIQPVDRVPTGFVPGSVAATIAMRAARPLAICGPPLEARDAAGDLLMRSHAMASTGTDPPARDSPDYPMLSPARQLSKVALSACGDTWPALSIRNARHARGQCTTAGSFHGFFVLANSQLPRHSFVSLYGNQVAVLAL